MIGQILAGSAAAATVFTFLVTGIIWWLQRHSNRVSRTYDLYQNYYGYDHYIWVHAPTQTIIVKWFNLPDDEREKYQKEVITFWTGFNKNFELLTRFTNVGELSGDHLQHHFRSTASKNGLSEAQILDINLHFWSGMYELLELKLIDKNICHRLFRAPFSWRREFYRELSGKVQSHWRLEDTEPDWISNIAKLDKFFLSKY